MNIANDKISLIKDILELINDLMSGIDENTSNDNGLKKLKQFKTQLNKLINRFNSYIKEDTKNISEPYTKNDTKPYSKDDIKSNINDIMASITKNQITVNKRYKSLLETKKTIRNNIDLVYSGLRKLSSESQLKANELIKLNTILNDSINVIWRGIHERDRKAIQKIDINKIKNVDSFIYELKDIINHKISLLKTSVILKLNLIISDIKINQIWMIFIIIVIKIKYL